MMIKFIEKLDQVMYSQFEIRRFKGFSTEIEDYWDQPYRL